MNRTSQDKGDAPRSILMRTFALTGFVAESNLRDVADALGQKDLAILAMASERNAKLARLRIEIDEQVAIEMAKITVGTRERKRLQLTAGIARMFEKFGACTIPVAQLCLQVLLHAKPSRLTEIKKLIEHVVYITDKAAQAFIDEDLAWAQTAVEQSRAATELYLRIKGDLAVLVGSSPDAFDRIDLLNRIADETHQILELVTVMARDVVTFLEAAEL